MRDVLPSLRRRTRLTQPSLLKQVLTVNAVLCAATVLAASVVARLDLGTSLGERQFDLLVAAMLATVLVNGFVLRRRFAPLERFIQAMERVDASHGAERPSLPPGETDEVARLHHAFERMLERLDDERNSTSAAVLGAQEAERARIARDLHDEANQALTGVLLRLQASAAHAPPELRCELAQTRAAVGQAMEELLRLARELRPAALDDHGLAAALRSNVQEFSKRTGIRADLEIASEVDTLGADDQIVVYRVVQESLSNVARHARAASVQVALTCDQHATTARITDDGRGFGNSSSGGVGIVGMRERAGLVGGSLQVRSRPGCGTTIELTLGSDR